MLLLLLPAGPCPRVCAGASGRWCRGAKAWWLFWEKKSEERGTPREGSKLVDNPKCCLLTSCYMPISSFSLGGLHPGRQTLSCRGGSAGTDPRPVGRGWWRQGLNPGLFGSKARVLKHSAGLPGRVEGCDKGRPQELGPGHGDLWRAVLDVVLALTPSCP